VHFVTGSSELDADAQRQLDAYASCVAEGHRHTLYITGSTDPVGTERDNATLARARARAVADYLHAAGCHGDFELRAYGEMGALRRRDLWPLERTATVSTVPPAH
jgi:outer membrane protein OmpA-like peptidoglycan-associated protein